MKNEWKYGFAKQELNFFEVTNLMFSLENSDNVQKFPSKNVFVKKTKTSWANSGALWVMNSSK